MPTALVDPCFQKQFHPGRNDSTYCSFLSTVPQLFVGTMPELEALVLTCAVSAWCVCLSGMGDYA